MQYKPFLCKPSRSEVVSIRHSRLDYVALPSCVTFSERGVLISWAQKRTGSK